MSMQFNSGRGLPLQINGVHGFAVRWGLYRLVSSHPILID
jgi:hypothetical protein